MNIPKLPKESESQEIGQFAVMAFYSCHPTSWRPTATDGDSDAGLDFQVQIIENGHYKNVFNAQIKGSKQEEKNKNKNLVYEGKYFSQSMSVSTLNYYLRIENPVMLVFVDLTHNENPRECPAYYLWIDEALDEIRNGKESLNHLQKESHTFNIPIENVLNPDLNILPYLNKRVNKKRALEGIFNTVEKKYPKDTIPKVSQIGNVLKTNKIALDTILNDSESPWLDAPKGCIAHDLKKISEYLSLHNAELAEDALTKLIERIDDANNHEKSEYFYLKGYLAGLLGNRKEALKCHKKAHSLSKNIKKYHIAYLQARIPYEHFDLEKAELSKIIKEIPNDKGSEYIHLKSKLLALEGDYKGALKIIDGQNEEDIFVLKSLIYLLSGAYSECVEQVEIAFKNHKPTRRQEISLRAIKARAFFYLGFKTDPTGISIPFSGLPGMNPSILKKAWLELVTAWDLAGQLGYPPDVETMIDMFPTLGMYFSEPNIVKKHIIKLAEIRPNIQSIQLCLSQIAMHLDDREIAEQQLSKIPKNLKNTLDKIVLYSRNNEQLKVVTSTIEILDVLLKEKLNNYDSIIIIAAACANDLFMNKERDKILKVIKNLPDSEALLALYDFMVKVNQGSLKKPEAINKLYEFYKEGHKHYQILAQLIHNLDPYSKDSAEKIIEISNDIFTSFDLMEDEYFILCQAKATIHDWEGLLYTSNKAQQRFSNPRYKAFESLALDGKGETGKSISLLEEIVKGEKFDPLAFEIYINISARCGLIDNAKKLVKRLFEKVTKKEQRLEILRMMFNIEMYINPQSDELYDICLKYGNLCDQNDEAEEGIYLLQFFTATLSPDKKINENDLNEFRRRLESYTKKYPESKILRSIKLDVTDPNKIISQLEKAAGFTEEKRKWYQRNENLFRNSQLPIPYLVRHYFLLNISNFIQLWELGKIASKEHNQYHLSISLDHYKIRKKEIFNGRIPFIDEMTLLVLFDLGLLEYLFRVFPIVAIPKTSLVNLLSLSQQFFGFAEAIKAKKIIEILSKYITQIQQPSSTIESNDKSVFNDLDLLKSAYDPQKYIYYTDDAISRIYICGDNHNDITISTMDLIILLKEYNLVTNKESAEKFALLCRYNVIGVLVSYMDILLVLKDDMPKGKTIEYYCERLKEHKNFNAFINGMWWFKGDYLKSLNEIGQFLSYMIVKEMGVEVEQNIITSIWFVWYQKVQFITKSEKNKLDFLVRSFMFICVEIIRRTKLNNCNSTIWENAWSIYNDIIMIVYGNNMDRSIEDGSKKRLAEMIVEYEDKFHMNIYNHIILGLRNGTSENELFKKAYADTIILKNKNAKDLKGLTIS
jgi:hypothetical protein